MKRTLFLGYGVACHLLFFCLYAYLAGFVGNLLVPKTIDSPPTVAPGVAVAINLLLLAGFAAQHSLMARPWFKQVWIRIIPQPIERSTYVLASLAVSTLLIWQWQPIDAVVWDVRNPAGRALLWGLFAAGWLLVPAVSLMINHFDLFGTRQVWLYFRGREYTSLSFRTPLLYGHVRHPLYVGWALAFWAIPTMTAGHLLFAGVMTVYMGVAAIFEERDLAAHFGHQYEEYAQRVPRYVPQLFHGAQLDLGVLRDPSWWHWVVTMPLLVAHVAGVPGALAAAMVLCASMTAYYFGRLRSVYPFPVQARLGFFALLCGGLLPGLYWLHLVQIAGTTALITTGYCPMIRMLSLLRFNRSARLTWGTARNILFAVPTEGGILRLAGDRPAVAAASCSLRSCSLPSMGRMERASLQQTGSLVGQQQ